MKQAAVLLLAFYFVAGSVVVEAISSDTEIAALCELTATITAETCGNCSEGCDVFCGTTRITPCNESNVIFTLNVANMQLSALPDSLGDFENLISLSASTNKLVALPDSLCSLANLETLVVSANDLKALPNDIGSLSRLRLLSVGENKLASLPASISSLSDLGILRLEGNQLSALPENIGSLTNLYTLTLNDNKLTALPESISSISDLNTFHFAGNMIREIPASFSSLQFWNNVVLDWNFLNCSTLNISDAVRNACDQEYQYSCSQFENETECGKFSAVCAWSNGTCADFFPQPQVNVVVIIRFIETVDVADTTELEEEIASVLGIDSGLVSVVVISPTEVEVTIIGSEETAQRLIDIIINGGAGSDGSGLGLLRKAIDAHIRKDTDGDGSSDDDGVDAACALCPFALVAASFALPGVLVKQF